MNTNPLTNQATIFIRLQPSSLNLLAATLVAFVFLMVPQGVHAQYTSTVSGNTVTFTSDGSSGVLVLGEQGGMLTHSSYAKEGSGAANRKDSLQSATSVLSLAEITKIVVNGGAGDDTLVINNPAGSVFAPNAVIEFNGGDGNDTLVIQGGGGADFHETYTPGPTKDAGMIETTNGMACQVIKFSGLEPVLDNVPAATLTINANDADNAINYTQGPGGGIFVGNTGLVAVDNLETFEFNNKTNLVINGKAGSDTINLDYQNSANPAGLTGTITVNGGDPTASDTLIVNGIAGVLDNLRYLPSSVGAGTVINDSEPQPNVLFTGIEHLTEVVQQADGDGVRLDGTTGNDAVEFFHGLTSDSGSFVGTMDQNNATGFGPFTMTPMNFTGAFPLANDSDVNFFNPGGTDSVVFNGTGNDDNIVVSGGEAGGTDFRNTLNGIVVARLEVFNVASCLVRGLDGNDNVTINAPAGPAAVAVRVEGGNSDVSTDTLNYNSPAGSATGINYGTSTITSTAPAGNPVTFSGVEVINETSSGATSTLTITGTAGPDSLAYTPTGTTAGTVTANGQPTINFTGVGLAGTFTLDPAGGVDAVSVNGTANSDSINTFRAGTNVAVQVGVLKTVVMPIANTEALQELGGLGDDQFNVNVGAAIGSDVIPVPLTIDGGGGTDLLDVFGAPPTAVSDVVATVGPAPGQGRMVYQGGGFAPVMTIDYANLEGPLDLVPATTLTVNATDADNSISYSDRQIIGAGGRVAVDNFAPLEFSNKTNLVINGLGGSDTINLNNPHTPPGLTGTITVNGGDPSGSDTLIANSEAHNLILEPTAQGAGTINYFGGGLPSTPFTGIEQLKFVTTSNNPFGVDGTTGDDQFEYTPGATPDTGTLVGTMNMSGAQFPLVPMTFVGVPQASVVVFNVFGQQGGQDSFVFNGTPTDDHVTVNNGGVFGGITVSDTVNGTLFANLNLNNMASATVQGNDGDDVFTHDGAVTIPLTYSGGNPSGSDVLNFNALSNAATTIDFGATAITSTGSGTVNFIGLETINETSIGGSPSLAVNGTSGGDNISFAPTGANAGTVTLAGLNPIVKFSGVPTLGLNGLDGNDFFNITPSSTVTVNVNGGNPIPPASPGDSITVNTAGTTGFGLSNTSGPTGLSGSFTFTNRNAVNFSQIEAFSPLQVSSTTINAVEGVPFSNVVVATFNAAAAATSNFTATINWGDGTAFSNGVITSGGPGTFSVKGGHTYTEEGSYNVKISVTDLTTSTSQEVTTTANVADAPLSITPLSPGAPTTISGVGAGANPAFLAYQAAIGGVNNGANPPPAAGGFRTINWDGVGMTATDGSFTNEVIDPNHVVGIPVNRFQERGVNFEEVYAVSDNGFTGVNPGVAGQFPAFSPSKTFAMFNDNTIDFNFVLPSTHTTPPIQAVTRGFGAIFVDVETPNTTSIEYFNGTTSLGKFFVPVGTTGQAEFFGVLFANPVVTNVEITLGNATLFSFDGTNVTSGPADAPPGTDLAVTDDFVYPEPQAVSTGININAIAGAPFTARVASFTDADPNGQVSDYSVVIDWGDGTTSAGGVAPNAAQPESGMMDPNASISPAINGGFDVNGTHTYATAGTFTITTSIRDTGGASISASSTATVTGQPSLSIGNVTVTEGNSGTTNAAFTVTLSGASSQTVNVDYVTSDGTATAPSDYDTQAGTLSFPPGVTTRTINVAVKGDTVPETNETFFVTLLNPVNASIAVAQGTGTINDDDEIGFVQFSSPTATVAENAGSVSLTVTRTGDTSGVTTVNFETSDGTAVQKSDYTFNSGTVQFNSGDTSKTIKILLVDDVFVEGSENFKVTLSNVSGGFVIASPNQITVTVTDNDSVPPVSNPIDDPTFFVRQHYLDFLGREPDASGLSFWVNQITACGANPSCIAAARVNVSAAFFLSIEYQETSGAAVRIQRAAFGKFSADPALRISYLQFMRDTRQIGTGVIVGQPGFDTLLEQNKQAYALQVVNSPAFLARFPIIPAADYVDALIASTGVTLTAAERTAAINAFGAGGTLGRVAALRSIADSGTVRQVEMIPSFVLAEFFGYLRRNPTDAPDFNDAGYQFWLAKLNAFNGNFIQAEMVKAFINSSEYRQRFGP